jgi:hypothetical protein
MDVAAGNRVADPHEAKQSLAGALLQRWSAGEQRGTNASEQIAFIGFDERPAARRPAPASSTMWTTSISGTCLVEGHQKIFARLIQTSKPVARPQILDLTAGDSNAAC